MRTLADFPRPIREIENLWIPLADGTKLAARIFLPADADSDPVPAILEYLPYRKRDGTVHRDALTHPYFAGHGYAAIRVDMRGTGDSEGLIADEYTKQEHDDALEIMSWIARQPWSTGRVGIMGISWGGFNGLQIAARRPKELKAVLTLASTDDRYADDIHYMGGALLNENAVWASVMFTMNAQPPDPAIVGPRWREMWQARLEANRPWIETWLSHQRRDDYWRHGSVIENYAAIEAPVYAVGGWEDGYSNAVPRLLAGLHCPKKGLIGPWSHRYPHFAKPEPAIGFLQEALRWWDHWLKDIDTGIMNEPLYRVWMQDSARPSTQYAERTGRWVAEFAWPSPRIADRRWHLNADGLGDTPARERAIDVRSPAYAGTGSGRWCGHSDGGEMPTDQRADDAAGLVFDSHPLSEPFEILGAPVVTLELASDRPIAQVAVRLNEVMPDGASARLSYGVLNLTHRESHAAPAALEPGKRYRVKVQLNDIAHRFAQGNRIRVAITTGYWPILWPAPEPVTLTLYAGPSTLSLPVRPASRADDELRPFLVPEAAPALRTSILEPETFRMTVDHDLVADRKTYTVLHDEGIARLEAVDIDVSAFNREVTAVDGRDPLSAAARIERSYGTARNGWDIRIATRTELTCEREHFHLACQLDAFEGGVRVFSRSWIKAIKRDLV